MLPRQLPQNAVMANHMLFVMNYSQGIIGSKEWQEKLDFLADVERLAELHGWDIKRMLHSVKTIVECRESIYKMQKKRVST